MRNITRYLAAALFMVMAGSSFAYDTCQADQTSQCRTGQRADQWRQDGGYDNSHCWHHISPWGCERADCCWSDDDRACYPCW